MSIGNFVEVTIKMMDEIEQETFEGESFQGSVGEHFAFVEC
jgi:hypothetical protein